MRVKVVTGMRYIDHLLDFGDGTGEIRKVLQMQLSDLRANSISGRFYEGYDSESAVWVDVPTESKP